jgi:hypothetical protein
MPVWSAISAGLLARLDPPAETSLIVVSADRDRSGAGEAAALSLRELLIGRRMSVAVHLPPAPIPARANGIDWVDFWCGYPQRNAARIIGRKILVPDHADGSGVVSLFFAAPG